MVAQVYPKLNFLDITIADTGIGIEQSYSDFLQEDIDFNRTIKLLFDQHYSTKNPYERGTGIRDSISFIQKGLKGAYSLLSGNVFAFVIPNNNFSPLNLENYHFYWQGVLISMRIPLNNLSQERVLNYIR
jgi:hypothetical protein